MLEGNYGCGKVVGNLGKNLAKKDLKELAFKWHSLRAIDVLSEIYLVTRLSKEYLFFILNF